jgi:hypothetical protein
MTRLAAEVSDDASSVAYVEVAEAMRGSIASA